jgi:hypothetical protein
VDPAATLFDDVHRAGRIPLADDHVALAILDRFQVGEQVVQSFGREFREDGELPEEELQVAEAGLKLEKLAHLGPPPEERVEDRSIEADHLHVPARSYSCGVDGVIAEAALPEGLPRPERAEGDLVSILSPLDHPHPAGDQYVQRVRCIAFLDDGLAKGVAGRDETGDHDFPHIVRKTAEHRETLEYRVEGIGIHSGHQANCHFTRCWA